MTIVLIEPLAGESDQRQRVALDGVFYTLRLRWNDRASTWFLDVLDDDDAPITTGIAVRVGSPFGAPYRTRAGMPPGVFAAIDSTGEARDPGLDDLGSRVRILYADLAELQAIAAEA